METIVRIIAFSNAATLFWRQNHTQPGPWRTFFHSRNTSSRVISQFISLLDKSIYILFYRQEFLFLLKENDSKTVHLECHVWYPEPWIEEDHFFDGSHITASLDTKRSCLPKDRQFPGFLDCQECCRLHWALHVAAAASRFSRPAGRGDDTRHIIWRIVRKADLYPIHVQGHTKEWGLPCGQHCCQSQKKADWRSWHKWSSSQEAQAIGIQQ